MKIKIQRNSLRSFLIRVSICVGGCFLPAIWPALQAQVSGTWNYTAGNDSWSNAARWVDGIVPNGIGDTANLTSAITTSRTITNNVGTITLGTLNIGTSANSNVGFTLSGGYCVWRPSMVPPSFRNLERVAVIRSARRFRSLPRWR
jgi:hypothetical protein